MKLRVYEVACLWIVMFINCLVVSMNCLEVSMNCHIFILSCLWIVVYMNCIVYELSCLWFVVLQTIVYINCRGYELQLSMICCFYKLSINWHVFECRVYEMARLWKSVYKLSCLNSLNLTKNTKWLIYYDYHWLSKTRK